MEPVNRQWLETFTRHIEDAGLTVEVLDQRDVMLVIRTGCGPAEAALEILRMRDLSNAIWCWADEQLFSFDRLTGQQHRMQVVSGVMWLN